MEVHFNADLQAKPDKLATETGPPTGELIEDAVLGYFDEPARARETLDRRYDDLKSGNYIAQDNPDAAADQVMVEILDCLRGLVTFPNQGHSRPDLKPRPLRFILVHEYLIAYAQDENPLSVVAVMQRTTPPHIMVAILKGRIVPAALRALASNPIRQCPATAKSGQLWASEKLIPATAGCGWCHRTGCWFCRARTARSSPPRRSC